MLYCSTRSGLTLAQVSYNITIILRILNFLTTLKKNTYIYTVSVTDLVYP